METKDTRSRGRRAAGRTGNLQQSAGTVRRRTLLAAIASGGAVAASHLPGQWKRPLIDSVMLPAHAQMSPPADTCTATVEIFEFWVQGETGTVTAPFTGTVGQIPPSSGEPSGSGTSLSARWFFTVTFISGTETVVTNGNSCETISRGSESYTIPLLVGDACVE